MYRSIFLLVLLGFYSCKQSGNNPLPKTHTPYIQQDDTSGFVAQKVEDWFSKFDVLPIDSITIDKQLSIYDTRVNLEALFGEPREVFVEEPYCATFFSFDADRLTFLKYDESSFEASKDSIALHVLHFGSTDKKLFSPKVILDKHTTLQSLKSVFPKSFAQQYEIGNENKMIVLPLLTCPNCDDEFFLIFENGLLVEIEHHIDC